MQSVDPDGSALFFIALLTRFRSVSSAVLAGEIYIVFIATTCATGLFSCAKLRWTNAAQVSP